MEEKERLKWRERIDKEVEKKGLDLNEEFKTALDCISAGENLFVTGSAGVGKSEFVQLVRDTYKGNMVVTSTTGISSANIRGVTMHSMFKLPLKAISKQSEFNTVAKKIHGDENKLRIMKYMDLLVVDEISMAKCFNLDTIDHVLRNLRDKPFVPFGGVQVLLIGDIFQLEPVVDRSSYEKDFLKENYDNNPYFFNASAYRTGGFKYIEFNHIYRQKNKEFQKVLNNFRSYNHTKSDFDYINQRVVKEAEFFNEGDYIYIASTNKKAEEVNNSWLASLDGEEIYYNAEVQGKTIKSNIPDVIVLKPESQIMMLRNNPAKGYYNGSLGIFKKAIDSENILVEIDGIPITVDLHTEQHIEYVYDKAENRVVEKIIGKKVQFPIKLAYALTVHKTQGLSLDRAYLDLGWKAFASGMSYVGLSRIRTLEGLGLKRALKESDFIISEHLKKFLEDVKTEDDEVVYDETKASTSSSRRTLKS